MSVCLSHCLSVCLSVCLSLTLSLHYHIEKIQFRTNLICKISFCLQSWSLSTAPQRRFTKPIPQSWGSSVGPLCCDKLDMALNKLALRADIHDKWCAFKTSKLIIGEFPKIGWFSHLLCFPVDQF